MSEYNESLRFALDKYPEKVEIVALERLVIDSARQNPRRPAYLKIAVPDDLVKEVRGTKRERDLILLVRIPHDVLDRAASPIVLPHEVR
jgi:hypothetical protein